ncbi:hypothetical protein F5Y13DRAFT_184903 [Hypoxylon sp. FL1857]|nr:hypothetical protein F5Y13DRAFT_184903 [Hypoxylon sp. FL1857]
MRFSRALQSSPHSLPSPDGELIATLLPSSIVVRAVKTLEVLRTIRVPPELTSGVTSFLWSPSSTKVLVAVVDQIHLFSATASNFYGTAKIPHSVAKSTVIDFGATDHEVCVWSPFGIKLTIVNFASSKVVEISNPKFYHAASATRGCSFRARTRHLALLTRSSGKDMISIHSPKTRETERSWCPDTIDAQGLAWTPDGKWLVVWESSAQAPRVILYTSDGHVFRDWKGPLPHAPNDMDLQHGAGVRLVALSPDSRLTAIANGSTCIRILNTPSMVEKMRLRHPQAIQPKDTLQIWQEQTALPNAGAFLLPAFVKATQAVTPQWSTSNSLQEPISGCNFAKFDCSSTLLATRLEDAPGTIWIWDIPTSDLRAVLMYHANVTKLEWHPMQPELLLIRCDGESYSSVVFTWDPLSNGPRSINTAHQFRENPNGRTHATWLRIAAESAAMFLTDNTTCMVASLADSDAETLAWQDEPVPTSPVSHKGDIDVQSSPRLASPIEDAEDSMNFDVDDDYTSELDDTFEFRKFIGH